MGLIMQPHAAAEYRDALLALLPQGRIWDEERESPDGELYRLCEVWAAEYAQMEATLQVLTREASLVTADEYLDDWIESAGVSLREGRKPIQRARTVAALTGSYASTSDGLAVIAGTMDYEAELASIVPPGEVVGVRCGQLRCGDAMWGTSYGLHRKLSISSEQPDFQVLKQQVDSQGRVAHLGSLRCGERLWESKADIQAILDVSLYEISTIESLLPAHLLVERVLV